MYELTLIRILWIQIATTFAAC